MTQAVVDGVVIAESDETVVVEGNHYFPPESIEREYFNESSRSTRCPWKGLASYYTVKVGDSELADVAWYYPEPSEAASEIKDHVAFYRPVTVGA
jgi:uncharacterized protein (DUF427 family)